MEIKKNNVIRFNNGDYLVVDVINYKDNTYLYLINNEEFENDVSLVKMISQNGITKYLQIEEEDEFDYVINKLFLEHKDEIKDFLEQ